MSGGLDFFLNTWTVDMVDFSGQQTGQREGITAGDTLTFKLDRGRVVCEPAIADSQSDANWTAAGLSFHGKEQSLRGFVQCGTELYEVMIRKLQQPGSGHGIECLYSPTSGNGNHNGTWHGQG